MLLQEQRIKNFFKIKAREIMGEGLSTNAKESIQNDFLQSTSIPKDISYHNIFSQKNHSFRDATIFKFEIRNKKRKVSKSCGPFKDQFIKHRFLISSSQTMEHHQ